MIKISKILYPCDLTENSTKVLPYVLTLSEKYDSMIYLLHVIRDLQRWGKLYIPHPSMDKLQQEAMEAAEKGLLKICDERMQGCPNFQRRIVSGDPSEEILKTIDKEGIDLVVMGTHGRKGLEKTLFGSVAENVVKKSPVPVFTVNPWNIT